MFRYGLVLAAALAAAGSARASWADALFEEFHCDFGAVPRGLALVHYFHLTNNTGLRVTLGNVRVSCGCTSARAQQTELAPGQSTAVVAVMDTERFQGPRQVTIFVEFLQPDFAEVRLVVQANSRDDIVLTPPAVAFGEIRKGASPSAAVTVSLFGNSQWRVAGAAAESHYVRTTLAALPGSLSQVNYRLTARLRPDTPAGKWFTVVWLQTNDPTAPRVRLPVTVTVR
jgi:hypothetical protein